MLFTLFFGGDVHDRIIDGFLGFGVLSLFGIWQLKRVLKGETRNWLGERNAPDWSYLLFGLACQIPLIAWLLFLKRQGYFESARG